MFNLIDKVKEVNPLVLHYTNNVTITDCANTTLAIGASPLMSFSYEDEFFITKLFEEEKDCIELIKIKEIMHELEKTTDAAEHVGKILKNLIVKYA